MIKFFWTQEAILGVGIPVLLFDTYEEAVASAKNSLNSQDIFYVYQTVLSLIGSFEIIVTKTVNNV